MTCLAKSPWRHADQYHASLARLRGLRSDLIDPAIAAHHGRIVKRTGDGSSPCFNVWG
jgi:class 3 adenylate cyclase